MNAKELFGITRPIIQSPMAGVQDSSLTIAVSNAGGLGSLPCAMLTHRQIVEELDIITQATTQPFNLNFFCHKTPEPNIHRETQWLNTLKHFFTEYGVRITDKPTSVPRQPFSADIIDIIEPFKPPILSFHFGLPPTILIDRAKAWGALIIASATTVDEARWLEANGADAVIAQGLEAGGHRALFLSTDMTSQVNSLALIPQIVSAVNLPVIAAGGFSDARSVASALALGAIAVQLGTSYLLCDEAKTSLLHRAAIKSEASQDTAVTNVFSGKPARSIINRLVREMGPMSTAVPEFPMAANAINALKQAAEADKCSDFSALWCGQNTAGCKEVSAATLTIELTPDGY